MSGEVSTTGHVNLPKRVYYYACDCEWRTKLCDEEHQRSITLDEIRAQAWDEGAAAGSPHTGAYLRSILIGNPYVKAGS